MKATTIIITLFFASIFTGFSQSKKELIAEVEKLKNEISETKNQLVESKKNERVCNTKLETMETQMESLKETNNTILSKMGSFTALSQQKSDNLEKSLQTIKKKDEQLNVINEALSKADSIKLATFSLFKNAVAGVGEKEAKLYLKNGAVCIDVANDFLFQTSNASDLTENSKTILLSKIAEVLKSKTDLIFQVEGNSNELNFINYNKDNWDLSSVQSAAVVRALQTEYSIDPKRMLVVGKSQYSTEAVDTKTTITILPKYDVFFNTIKESMKE